MKIDRRGMLKSGLGLAAIMPSNVLRGRLSGYKPAEVEGMIASGRPVKSLTRADLTTPALILDLDLLESNIAGMARHAAEAEISLRPHAKTHKCVEIARLQARAGAIGHCVATIREAEAMASAGIRNLLITSEMVGKPRIERLIRLTRLAPSTMSVVDNLAHAEQLDAAAGAAKMKLGVMIDVDPAGRRTGVPAGAEAEKLAAAVAKLPNLRLKGIHGYSGTSAHVAGFEARRAHSTKVMTPVIETFHKLKKAGLPMEIMSGGSTGTYNIDSGLDGMTELQVGSYVFMDVEYRSIGGQAGPVYEDFAPSLSVLATVISKSYSDHATTDAGIKAFTTDKPRHLPEIKGASGVTLGYGGDEHGLLIFNNPSRDFNIGDRVEFIVPHCDPNVNLYDRIFCFRGERLESVWRTVGRYGD